MFEVIVTTLYVIPNATQTCRVIVFQRIDASFGFAEERFSDGAWIPFGRYSECRCDTAERALAEARTRVAWFAAKDGAACAQKWREGLSRVEEGVFFGNGACVLLVAAPETGYTVRARQPVTDLLARDPEGWCTLDRFATAHAAGRGWTVHAGETSWEGEGWVALVTAATGDLLWLLHLSESEAFVEVAIEDETIRAVSGRYPRRYAWSIPALAPERFVVESCVADHDDTDHPAPHAAPF